MSDKRPGEHKLVGCIVREFVSKMSGMTHYEIITMLETSVLSDASYKLDTARERYPNDKVSLFVKVIDYIA
jgi:hypothetical protein